MLINLKAEMARKGVTITDMAKYMKMSNNSFSWKLNGKREFTLTEMKRIADYFQVSIDYLAEKSA